MRSYLLLIKDTLGRTLGYEWEKLTTLDKKEYLGESVESFIQSRGVKVDPITGRSSATTSCATSSATA